VVLTRAERNARRLASLAGTEDPDEIAIESGMVAEALA
jgi:hypothetical protein